MELINKIKEIYENFKYKKEYLIIISIILFIVLIFFWIKQYEFDKEQIRLEKIKQEEFFKKQEQLRKQKEKELIIKKALEDKQKHIDNLDLETDSSFTKFVSSDISFSNKAYIPEDLEKITWEYVYDAKWWRQLLRKEASVALEKMSLDFYRAFEKQIVVVSAYRSYTYQKGIKDRGCPDNLCAKAGYSEHQSWLAIDLWETSTNKQFLWQAKLKKYFDWLNQNAYKYGFHNTYQKGLEIDTYEIEPWHWRYMWVELALYLKEKNLTFAEYYNKIH